MEICLAVIGALSGVKRYFCLFCFVFHVSSGKIAKHSWRSTMFWPYITLDIAERSINELAILRKLTGYGTENLEDRKQKALKSRISPETSIRFPEWE